MQSRNVASDFHDKFNNLVLNIQIRIYSMCDKINAIITLLTELFFKNKKKKKY